MADIVRTQGLCKQYGKVLRVDRLDLRVPEGAIYGFLGPNGAGKSTNGHNRLDMLKQVGSLIESPSYYGHLTGEENLKVIQTLRGVPEKDVYEVLEIVRLEGQRNKKAAHYSLGMKQRLGLAAALMGFPRLLILDEPTNGLDPAGIQEMRELICSLPARFGMTVLVSSHLLSEIDQMADHVGIIREGELVFQDTLETLHRHSRHNLALRTGDNEGALKLLRQSRVPCAQEEDYILLPRLDDPDAAKLIRYLIGHGVDVLRLEERQKSLEDIFLKLTGGKAASL